MRYIIVTMIVLLATCQPAHANDIEEFFDCFFHWDWAYCDDQSDQQAGTLDDWTYCPPIDWDKLCRDCHIALERPCEPVVVFRPVTCPEPQVPSSEPIPAPGAILLAAIGVVSVRMSRQRVIQ